MWGFRPEFPRLLLASVQGFRGYDLVCSLPKRSGGMGVGGSRPEPSLLLVGQQGVRSGGYGVGPGIPRGFGRTEQESAFSFIGWKRVGVFGVYGLWFGSFGVGGYRPEVGLLPLLPDLVW